MSGSGVGGWGGGVTITIKNKSLANHICLPFLHALYTVITVLKTCLLHLSHGFDFGSIMRNALIVPFYTIIHQWHSNYTLTNFQFSQ